MAVSSTTFGLRERLRREPLQFDDAAAHRDVAIPIALGHVLQDVLFALGQRFVADVLGEARRDFRALGVRGLKEMPMVRRILIPRRMPRSSRTSTRTGS